jgi:ribose transport system permease protein
MDFRHSGRRSSRSSSPSPSAASTVHGRVCRGAGAVRHPGDDARCLRRVVLDLAGLRRYAPQDADALLFAGRGSLFGIPMPIIVFAAAAVVMHLFLSRTSTGRFIYAQGDNPEAAKLSGIALRPLTILEHVLVALFAWLAGLVWIGQTGNMQTNIVIIGTQIFDVILVVVLGGISLVGGRGGVFSVIVGCALIGTLLNAFTIMDVNTEVQNIIRGVVLLLAIIVDNWLHPRDEETARQGD